jgi:16S rRNA (guanine966-N2)-methyltransferase
LAVPPGEQVRPTTDRVRGAIFNALGSLGAVEGAAVLDLFAGSGALGIEALSRGAAHATFVEPDRRARRCIEENLAATGLADRARVVAARAEAFLAGAGTGAPAGAPAEGARWDLALVDPPYAFDDWPRLLAALPADLAVVESDRPVALGAGWDVVRERRYGTTFVLFARCVATTSTELL